jgi:hypothetical protein
MPRPSPTDLAAQWARKESAIGALIKAATTKAVLFLLLFLADHIATKPGCLVPAAATR